MQSDLDISSNNNSRAAIEKAGCLDSAKVGDAVFKYEFKGTVMGDVIYSPERSAGFKAATFLGWDGKQKLVYSFVQGTWQTGVMSPWDKR